MLLEDSDYYGIQSGTAYHNWGLSALSFGDIMNRAK